MKNEVITNTVYQSLRDFIEDHSGYSGTDFKDHPEIMPSYEEFMALLCSLNNKRVELKVCIPFGFANAIMTKIGRIKVNDNRPCFYEGKKTTRFYHLDAGLYEGFFATLIPLQITILN